jgi:hypothetical protein
MSLAADDDTSSSSEELVEHYRLLWLSLDEQVRALATNAVFPRDASHVGHLRHTPLQAYVADDDSNRDGVLQQLAQHAARTDEHLRALHRRFAIEHEQQRPQDDQAEHSRLNLLRQQLAQTQSELEQLRAAYDSTASTLQALHGLNDRDRSHIQVQQLLDQHQRQQSSLQSMERLSDEQARAERELDVWTARQRSLETDLQALRGQDASVAREQQPSAQVFQATSSAKVPASRPLSPPPPLPAVTRTVASPQKQPLRRGHASLGNSLLRRLATFQSLK